MSVVIVGGNDCMVTRYENLCKEHNCKAKVFTQHSSNLKQKIGQPDLLILFTNTVSHKMVLTATKETANSNTKIVRSHSSSASALKKILADNVKVV